MRNTVHYVPNITDLNLLRFKKEDASKEMDLKAVRVCGKSE